MSQVPRILVVDDEPIALAAIKALLEGDASVELYGATTQPEEALRAVLAGHVDILILDIQMPGMSGLDLARAIPPARRPKIIFATAFDDHAVEAFEANAVDYVLKPVSPRRLHEALTRAKQSLRDQTAHAALQRVLSALDAFPVGPAPGPVQRSGEDALSSLTLPLPEDGGVRRVDLRSIQRVEASGQCSIVVTDDAQLRIRRSLSEMERSLDQDLFLRVHRSHVVAISQIKALIRQEGGTGTAELRSGEAIPVSRSRFPGVKSLLSRR